MWRPRGQPAAAPQTRSLREKFVNPLEPVLLADVPDFIQIKIGIPGQQLNNVGLGFVAAGIEFERDKMRNGDDPERTVVPHDKSREPHGIFYHCRETTAIRC